jgi:hypothetical protein
MTYTIDAKTPKGQAGQMLRAIKAIAKASGLSAEYAEVRLYGEPEGGKAYQVVWEDGPFEWGVKIKAGGDYEHGRYTMGGPQGHCGTYRRAAL